MNTSEMDPWTRRDVKMNDEEPQLRLYQPQSQNTVCVCVCVCVCLALAFPVPVFQLASMLKLTCLLDWLTDSARARGTGRHFPDVPLRPRCSHSPSVHEHSSDPQARLWFYDPPGGCWARSHLQLWWRSVLWALLDLGSLPPRRFFRLSQYPVLRQRWRHRWAGFGNNNDLI